MNQPNDNKDNKESSSSLSSMQQSQNEHKDERTKEGGNSDAAMTRQLFDPSTRKFSSVVVGDNARIREGCDVEVLSPSSTTHKTMPTQSNPSVVKSTKNEGKIGSRQHQTQNQNAGNTGGFAYTKNNNYVTNSGTNKNSNVNFCNNCGRIGHIFQQCKQPITSIGIIAFRYNIDKTKYDSKDKFEYLMINRQHSLGYVEFMRGKYPVHNYDYLINIFNEMTIKEKEKIKCSSFSQLWRDLWGDHIGQQYRNEEKTSREKFNILKLGVDIGTTKEKYSLEILIENSNNLVQWSDTEWGFPKGRRNFQEKDLACAYREFEEETGYTKKNLHLIQNVMPFEEIFTGSNMKSYKHKYFLAYMEPESSHCVFPEEYHSSEVGEMKWLTFCECISRMRPYNVEKIDILNKVDNLLQDFSIHYAIQ